MSKSPALRPTATELAKETLEKGWFALQSSGEAYELSIELLSLAREIGRPLAGRGGIVESLKPIPASNALPRSLSAAHGTGAFPLHTDGAHLPDPPRFILLACLDPGISPAPTTLLRFAEIGLDDSERNECEHATFLFRNGRRSFYSCISDRARPFVRFDSGCMVPTDAASEATFNSISNRIGSLSPYRFEWRCGDILLIDNWQTLHGRGAATDSGPDRHLLRVSVQ